MSAEPVDRKGEWFATPPYATIALLAAEMMRIRRAATPAGQVQPVPPSRVTAVEPCCGNGALAVVLARAGFKVDAADLHNRGFGRTGENFLEARALAGPVVITNPPWSLAEAFVRQALDLGARYVAMLLPLDFYSSGVRGPAWRELPLATWYACAFRVDFLPEERGKTPPQNFNCAWGVWIAGYRHPPEFGRLEKPRWTGA